MSSLNKNTEFVPNGPSEGNGRKPATSSEARSYVEGKSFTSPATASTSRNNSGASTQQPRSKVDKGVETGYSSSSKQEVVSITYEEIGLFPRSFSRVLDRFLKQVFSDVENLVIQEYRFYRYLFLTTLKCLLILFFIPFFVNLIAKTYIVRPLTEFFWNTKQTEIFLNSYQQKHAFAELKEFEEKTYFESLIFPKSVFVSNIPSVVLPPKGLEVEVKPFNINVAPTAPTLPSENRTKPTGGSNSDTSLFSFGTPGSNQTPNGSPLLTPSEYGAALPAGSGNFGQDGLNKVVNVFEQKTLPQRSNTKQSTRESEKTNNTNKVLPLNNFSDELKLVSRNSITSLPSNEASFVNQRGQETEEKRQTQMVRVVANEGSSVYLTESNMKSSLFVYQTQEADKNIQQRYQEKTIEIAQRYNDQSMEAITNIFADLISLLTLFYLLYALEIQINITKSFLLEVFFGLDDSKKSLLILLITDLLVGYHSSNLWELFFEFLFHHYGLPESQTGIFLLVATLPVLLDVLFKYLIFRHLNRSSPATVATYHAMIE